MQTTFLQTKWQMEGVNFDFEKEMTERWNHEEEKQTKQNKNFFPNLKCGKMKKDTETNKAVNF